MFNNSEPVFYLGVDWGTAKIGLATADSVNKMATPLTVVKTLEEVIAIIKREDISVLVVGKPVHMGGGQLTFTKGFAEFVTKLSLKRGLDIHYIDERLTSKQAQGLEGDKKNKAKEDAIAAMLILQTFLDRS